MSNDAMPDDAAALIDDIEIKLAKLAEPDLHALLRTDAERFMALLHARFLKLERHIGEIRRTCGLRD